MSNITFKIQKGAIEEVFTLIDQGDNTYKLDHPKADPNRFFIKNGEDESELVMYALMHLTTR